MARPARGNIQTTTLADGTEKYRLRFQANGERRDVILHERRDCSCGCGGGWSKRTARAELDTIIAKVRAGVWRTPLPRSAPAPPNGMPSFHEYASSWLERKRNGTIGDRTITPSTYQHYRGALTNHVLPYFARHRLDEIDRHLCLAFKAHVIREATELREAIAAGAEIRDRRGRRCVPIGASYLKKLIGVLAMVLDEAVEDELIDRNPARGKRMRVRVPKPKRSFLELDELAELLDAAAAQETLPRFAAEALAGDGTQARVARRAAAGRRPQDIARELGITKQTVSFHLNRLGAAAPIGYIGRRAVVEILARSGVRASELCDLRIRDVRLHDPAGARFHIRDAKTDAGVREVQMTPDLVEAAVEHLDRLRRAGKPTDPNAYLVPNRRGGRMDRQRVGEIVGEAAKLASTRRAERDLPALPHITPHSLRRTYISLALVANDFDVKWVMSQVGHADSKMTLDVYAQLEQRIPRHHGENLDRLLRGEAPGDDSGPHMPAEQMQTIHR
ncbi:tyrosine-type recombinase/integrase [Thermoleophilia bacterium SCSIO 60948]|nr:tyrosine-type recombinase/integrase [Thermoleophilia bacterium SCSIO 60948]